MGRKVLEVIIDEKIIIKYKCYNCNKGLTVYQDKYNDDNHPTLRADTIKDFIKTDDHIKKYNFTENWKWLLLEQNTIISLQWNCKQCGEIGLSSDTHVISPFYGTKNGKDQY